ncbi:hypothetical protein K1719_017778 [Acacia pycnantha]|nr:hypothetical protein K1719_017778 [Acacia pycnantha]
MHWNKFCGGTIFDATYVPGTNTISVSTKAFEKMERLRLLQLGHVQLEGDYKYLSTNLKWICWHGFHKNNTPSKFYRESSVAIDLKYSNLKTVWKNPRFLEKLKFLNLSHSHYLIQTPDFSNLPNLERLVLRDCSRLSMVHDRIEQLDNTAIRKVPFSLVRSNFGDISMCGYEGSSRDVFPSLIWSWMSPKSNPLSLLQPFEG